MTDTPSTDESLLLRILNTDSKAWQDFTNIYGPLVYTWSRRKGLQPDDAGDVTQDVMMTVLTKLQQRKPDGKFRAWLWSVFRSRMADHYRAKQKTGVGQGGSTANAMMQEIAEHPVADDSQEGLQDRNDLRRRSVNLIKDHFESHHWTAFWRTAIEGDAPADVASDLGVSVWVVYKSKARVMERLRTQFDGLDLWPDAEHAGS